MTSGGTPAVQSAHTHNAGRVSRRSDRGEPLTESADPAPSSFNRVVPSSSTEQLVSQGGGGSRIAERLTHKRATPSSANDPDPNVKVSRGNDEPLRKALSTQGPSSVGSLSAKIVPGVSLPDSFGDSGGDDDEDDDPAAVDVVKKITKHVRPRAQSPNPLTDAAALPEYQLDLLVQSIVTQTIHDLKENHFLRPSMSSASSMRNQGFYYRWVTIGITAWIKVVGPFVHEAEFDTFVNLFANLDDAGQSISCWNLDIAVLKKLFWLSGAGFTVHDRTATFSPRIQLSEFCLLLMWLGPADMTSIVPASDAIAMIYEWVTSNKDRVNVYQGICSRQSAISTLRFSTFKCVYHLNEGRMECGREFPADYRIEYFCRNLVCTSASNDDKTIGARYRHDLMVDITRVTDLSVTSVAIASAASSAMTTTTQP